MTNAITVFQKKSIEDTISLVKCTANREVTKYVVAERGITLPVAAKGVPLRLLGNRLGEEDVVRGVFGLIMITQEYFNVKLPMTEVQAIQVASLLIESYPAESFEDFVLCFKNAKMGNYGVLFAKIDGTDIFKWMGMYLNEKYSYLEQERHNQKFEETENEKKAIGGITKTLLQIAESVKEKLPKNRSGISQDNEIKTLKEIVTVADKDQLINMLDTYKREARFSTFNTYNEQISIISNQIETHENKQSGK